MTFKKFIYGICLNNNYRLNLYIQHIRKKVPLDYAEIHPVDNKFLQNYIEDCEFW
ncbi:hypothetical protein SAP269_21860 (plasmid) [Spiroplasma ixodetis]|uniref:Uncharacterized protein n=1 Tax=Spiroplasma ixodetis TaxID=2141 RepID=A0ABN7BXD4_9MOLU